MSFPFTMKAAQVACIALLGFVLLCRASAQWATLATLDGDEQSGRLTALTDRSVVLSGAQGETHVSLAQTHWLSIDGVASVSVAESGFVELTDGPVVPTDDLTADQRTLKLRLPAPLANSDGRDALEIAYGEVASYVFARGDEALQRQWRLLRQVDSTSDLIVVKRRDGQTLDYVEGIVTAVTNEKVEVLLDGDPVSVKRSKVYGVVCFRPDARPAAESPVARVELAGGNLPADRVLWRADELARVNVPGLAEFRLPIESIRLIDYSRGGVVLLSDLEPATVDWEPFFDPPGVAALVQEWGLPRADRSYSGGPITLREADGRLRAYAKGLAIRSRGEALYQTPPQASYFRATIGLAPDSSSASTVDLHIEGDGTELYSQTFVASEPPREVELPISTITRLRIQVDFGRGADAGDNLHLANARFTR